MLDFFKVRMVYSVRKCRFAVFLPKLTCFTHFFGELAFANLILILIVHPINVAQNVCYPGRRRERGPNLAARGVHERFAGIVCRNYLVRALHHRVFDRKVNLSYF